MYRRVAYLAAITGLGLTVAGCLGYPSFERRANWRDDEERVCMRQRELAASAYIETVSKINGKGACGVSKPLKVRALADGTINIGPIATIGCPMTAALEGWVQEAVQPAALAWFGMPVGEIKQISAYYCRTRNSKRGADLSEHAFGNALDIAGFVLVDGREITVLKGWKGAKDERGFLREVFAHGCQHFKTSLGPGVKNHADHFHFDLAHHNDAGTTRYCRPKQEGAPPVRPPFGGYVIATRQQQPGLAQAAYGQPAYGQATYGQQVYGQAGLAQPGFAPPVDIQPTVMTMPPPQYPEPQYPDSGSSVGALPENVYWPRRLPPASVPMSYAGQ